MKIQLKPSFDGQALWSLGQMERISSLVFHSVDIYFLFDHRLCLLEQVWSGPWQGCGLLCQPHDQTMDFESGGLIDHPTINCISCWFMKPAALFRSFSLPFLLCWSCFLDLLSLCSLIYFLVIGSTPSHNFIRKGICQISF